ncbi:MAG: helix-turn-helix domain-containing protein [Eubacteriales bacterium]
MNKNNLKNKDLATLLGLSKSAISNYIAGISVLEPKCCQK